MPEYIDREAAFDAVFGQFCASSDETEAALNSAVEDIKRIPAADVAPVLRGKWVKHGFVRFENQAYTGSVECSNCRRFLPMPENFCPNCGAKMGVN